MQPNTKNLTISAEFTIRRNTVNSYIDNCPFRFVSVDVFVSKSFIEKCLNLLKIL